MRSVLAVLLLASMGPLRLCPGVRAQNSQNGPTGGEGNLATSLCAEFIIPNGYGCSEHQAVTDDGFILGIQHIPGYPPGGPPVFLMHGVLAGGDNWCDNNPQESLAFILAAAGYDVWIGNNRAVQWSHGHETLNSSQNAYWEWTYDELASYDLKALTGYVYNATNNTKLIYIGHSQGTLLLFAGLTGGKFKTEILGYLNATVLLAPVAFVTYITAPILSLSLRSYSDVIFASMGDGELNASIYFNYTCTQQETPPIACSSIYIGFLGLNSYLNQSRLSFYSQYYPQPTSTFNVNHYGQSLRTNTFQFYDKGEAGNMKDYGQSTPPPYDLTTFPSSLPYQIWHGCIDGLADPIDVATLLSLLPSSNGQVFNLTNYGHVDFIMGTNAHVDVFPRLMQFLQNHTQRT